MDRKIEKEKYPFFFFLELFICRSLANDYSAPFLFSSLSLPIPVAAFQIFLRFSGLADVIFSPEI